VGDVTFNGGTTSSNNSGGGGAAGPSGAGASPSGTSGGSANNGTIAGGTGGASPTNGASGVIWTDNSRTASDGITAGPGGGGGGSTTAGVVGASGGFYGGGQGVGPGGQGSAQQGVIILEWYGLAPPAQITSATTHTVMPYSTYTCLLTSDDPEVTWAITGGTNASDFSLSGSILSLDVPTEPNTTKVVEITATDSASNAIVQNITVNTLKHARRLVRSY
jgi:hypothetical protein